MSPNKNCLSYWFPILEKAGIPVPKTEIIRLPKGGRELMPNMDGYKFAGELTEDEKKRNKQIEDDSMNGISDAFVSLANSIESAAYDINPSNPFPFFLRTGQTSGKHDWKRTCFVTREIPVEHHIHALIEFSECAGFFGLPFDVWCVRELLPVNPIAVLPRYNDMPLVKEMRVFVRDGKVECVHPYWPAKSIVQGFPKAAVSETGKDYLADVSKLASQFGKDESIRYMELALQVAKLFDGQGGWSVDILETQRGLFVTDMAVAEDSWHWPECKNSNVITKANEQADDTDEFDEGTLVPVEKNLE